MVKLRPSDEDSVVRLDNVGELILTRMDTVNMENCLILKNSFYTSHLLYEGPSIVFGIGVVYTDGVNIMFNGTAPGTSIIGNHDTAILANSAIIKMYGFVYIANNIGFRGGGVYLVGGSSILIGKSLRLTFSDNIAQLYGGAIFHSYPSQGVIGLNKYCIFVYEDSNINDPTKWLANIFFVNNTAGFSGNSIFISSPASCHVSSNNIPFTESIYHFEPTKAQVVSSPVRLEFPRFNDSEVMLGQALELEVVAYDAFEHSVRAPVLVSLFCRKGHQILPDEQCHFNLDGTRLVQISEKQDQHQHQVINNSLSSRTTFFITGPELDHPSNVVLIWQTLENAPVSLGFLNVTIKGKCKLGFVFDHLQQKCVCSNNNDHVYCSTDTYTACVEEGYWYGEIDNNTFEAVSCPFGNCNYTTGNCPTGSCAGQKSYCNLDDNNHNALCYGNRADLLCSKCINNTHFTFDAIQCTDQCSSGSSTLVVFLVLLFWVILVVGLLVVIGLDLHIGSGQLYCFFFFFSVLQYDWKFLRKTCNRNKSPSLRVQLDETSDNQFNCIQHR